MNRDISVFKHVPLGGSRRLQLRVELYNAFNMDQLAQLSGGVRATAVSERQRLVLMVR